MSVGSDRSSFLREFSSRNWQSPQVCETRPFTRDHQNNWHEVMYCPSLLVRRKNEITRSIHRFRRLRGFEEIKTRGIDDSNSCTNNTYRSSCRSPSWNLRQSEKSVDLFSSSLLYGFQEFVALGRAKLPLSLTWQSAGTRTAQQELRPPTMRNQFLGCV